MNDDASSARHIHAAIYTDLDRRLRASPFGGGAAEAHGVLCALGCRGVPAGRLRAMAAKAGLQPTAAADLEAIDGLYALIARDLRADDFAFQLMLPGEAAGAAVCMVALADWCGGFMRGFLHDGEDILDDCPPDSREAFGDIVRISRLQAPTVVIEHADGDGDGDATGGDADGDGDGDGDATGDAADPDDDAPLTEEEALSHLALLEEHLRMAAQLLFEELNPPGRPVRPTTPLAL